MSHGSMVKLLIEEGHINGEDFYQIGLNSVKPSSKYMVWMHQSGLKFYFMQEIDNSGWDCIEVDYESIYTTIGSGIHCSTASIWRES